MSKEASWYFVYTSVPDAPSILKAMFWSKQEAEDYRLGNGYLQIRRAYWKGYGPLPAWSDTEKV